MSGHTSFNWKSWGSSEDIPMDLRATIAQGTFLPLLDPAAAKQLRNVVMETFSEVVDTYLEEVELKWRCDYVHQVHPNIPMEAVFTAISMTIGVSVPRLRTVWYVSRRKSRVTELVRKKVGAEK